MERVNADEFFAEIEKSRKRRHDDQDPLPPPLTQIQTSDTRESPSSSSKQQSGAYFEQPVKDVPMPDTALMSDSEDIDSAYLLKIKPRPEWLKPILKEDRPATRDTARMVALSISKLKAANYSDFRLEELVLSLWIKSERDYNISATYGITHWWFKRKDFYITRHNAPSDRCAVRSHMWILSVISIKTFKRSISASSLRQHVGDLQLSIKSYQTKLNLTDLRWDASNFLFKEDHTIISKPRAVIYRDRNDWKKMLRENEVHKFSDGTLIRVLHKLDHMVKGFRLY
nr:hypothetical protein [Tanacetum cinerariifolium]